MKIYRSAEDLIGKTPLLELNRITKKYNLKANIIAKLDGNQWKYEIESEYMA